MKRILFILARFNPHDGADRSGLAVLEVLRAYAGVRCDVLELFPVSDAPVSGTGNWYQIPQAVPLNNRHIHRWQYVRALGRRLWADWRYTWLWAWLPRRRYDLLVSNVFHEGMTVRKLSARIKMAILNNAPDTYSRIFWGLNTWSATVRAAASYDRCVAVSAATAATWDQSGLLRQKCTVIPNTIDESQCLAVMQQDRNELRARCNMTGHPNVVCVASIEYRKGQDVLLDAWIRVREAFQEARLYLVGRPRRDSWYATFREKLKQHGDTVVEVGAVTNPLDYTRAADLAVLPSRAEALPLTVLEAMYLKTPVVASAVAGIPEMIVDAVTGRCVPAGDAPALGTAIMELLENKALRYSYAEKAHTHYLNNYRQTLLAERWTTLLDDVLKT